MDSAKNQFINFIKKTYKKFKEYLVQLLDIIINGITINGDRKYYKYFISLTILIILILIYFFIYNINPFEIKETKHEIILTLFLLSISLIIFYFFVYRKHINQENFIKSSQETNKFDLNAIYKKDYYYNDLDLVKITNNKKQFNESNFKKSVKDPLKNLLKYYFTTISGILLIIITIVFLFWIYNNFNNSLEITRIIIGILIVITGLAAIAKLFSINTNPNSNDCNKIQNPLQKIICIIKNFIFFIPCLLVIIVDDLNDNIKLTPSSIYILFFIELILITIIFLLPALFKLINTINKSNLLNGEGPYYLNEKRIIAEYQNLNKTNLSKNDFNLPDMSIFSNIETENIKNNLYNTLNIDKSEYNKYINIDKNNKKNNEEDNNEIINLIEEKSNTLFKGFNFKLFKKDLDDKYNILTKYYGNEQQNSKKNPYSYTYSISFYLYLNPQPNNTNINYTENTELFNYAFKPVVYYNGKNNKIIIKSRTINNKGDQLDTIYETKNFKYQKWLYFVINYDNNIIDIFIDGKLVASKNNITPYFIGDKVTIGYNNGINGSIKEIYYYNKIKPPSEIQFLYNLALNK